MTPLRDKKLGHLQSGKMILAEIISLTTHPFLISCLSILLLLYLDTNDLRRSVLYSGLFAALVIFPASIFLYFKISKGHYTNINVSVRKHRNGFYILGIVCLISYFTTILIFFDPPRLLLILASTAILVALAFALVTKWWTKISIHSGVITGLTAAVAFYSWHLFVFLVFLTLIVSWSRLTLSQHTIGQITLSWIVSASIISINFSFLL